MITLFNRINQITTEGFKHAYVWFILFFAFLPLFVVFNISFKSNEQFFRNPWFPELPLRLLNWAEGWALVGASIFNSVFIAVTATALTVVMAVGAAYFFARFHLPGKKILWMFFLAVMLIPTVVNIIPLFTVLRELNLLNSYAGIILPMCSGGQVVAIFLLRNFIEEIPNDLFDAAQIDGAGHIQQIINVVIPMSAPIIATVCILRFLAGWNNFILPLVVLRDEEKYPMVVALYGAEGAYVKDWGALMASYSIAAIPLIIMFIFAMRVFIRGLGSGAIKG